MKIPSNDLILLDLYRFREEHAAAYNFDVSAMMEELIHEQDELEKQGRRFAPYPPRRCQPEFPYTPIEETPLSAPPIDINPQISDGSTSSHSA